MRNPWILLALATAAFPWLFALRNRSPEPPKTVVFPALFLLTTSQNFYYRTKKRRRLWLATLRSAALVLLTFAWGAPIEINGKNEENDVLPPQERRPSNETRRVENGRVDGRPIRVLIVDGSDSGEPFSKDALPAAKGTTPNRANAAFYFAAALDPTFKSSKDGTDASKKSEMTDSSNLSPFPNVETSTSAEFSLLSASELDVFDAICWIDLSAATSEEIEKTERFLSQPGKALVVCAGPRLRIERWNELWKRWNVDAKTLDVELDPATGEPREPFNFSFRQENEKTARRLKKSFLEAAFLRTFEKTPNTGVEKLPIWRLFPIVGNDAESALRDAKTSAPIVSKIDVDFNAKRVPESDVLQESRVRFGSVFWFATVPDESTSALAFAPIFVPLAERIVEFAVADSYGEMPQSSDNIRFNVSTNVKKTRKKNSLPIAIWGALGVVAALEIALAFPSSRRRRYLL